VESAPRTISSSPTVCHVRLATVGDRAFLVATARIPNSMSSQQSHYKFPEFV